MRIDENNGRHLIASEGMVLKRISDGVIFGSEVMLGRVLIDGEIVPDFPENYIEIEASEEDYNNENEDVDIDEAL